MCVTLEQKKNRGVETSMVVVVWRLSEWNKKKRVN